MRPNPVGCCPAAWGNPSSAVAFRWRPPRGQQLSPTELPLAGVPRGVRAVWFALRTGDQDRASFCSQMPNIRGLLPAVDRGQHPGGARQAVRGTRRAVQLRQGGGGDMSRHPGPPLAPVATSNANASELPSWTPSGQKATSWSAARPNCICAGRGSQ